MVAFRVLFQGCGGRACGNRYPLWVYHGLSSFSLLKIAVKCHIGSVQNATIYFCVYNCIYNIYIQYMIIYDPYIIPLSPYDFRFHQIPRSLQTAARAAPSHCSVAASPQSLLELHSQGTPPGASSPDVPTTDLTPLGP